MDQPKIEIGQYRELDAGALKATFTLIEYPYGRKTIECKYFIQGNNRWWSFPTKKVEYKDGRKSQYIPFNSYIDKGYMEQLKAVVLQELKKQQESYVKKEAPQQTRHI